MSDSTGQPSDATSPPGRNVDLSVTPELNALFMGRALELAARGEGYVEPNPMVGCVIVNDGEVVGEGWHRKFGGPHAEAEALQTAGPRARGATAYVTLEPCCHHGKTPPCASALIAAGIKRVICAQRDPFEAVSGRGILALEAAGIRVEVGVMQAEAQRLNAPYVKLVTTGRPWIIAKWAMTLDGKIATHTGDSRWISGEASREIVQNLRGRVDAIVVGGNTARHDNPLLLARPAGARVALRVVIDSMGSIQPDSQLVRTAGRAPVLIAVGPQAPQENLDRLTALGCEVLVCRTINSSETETATKSEENSPSEARPENKSGRIAVDALLDELGRRRLTNVLVEGGGELLGSLFDLGAIDEVHAFIAPKLLGGKESTTPIAGRGLEKIASALQIAELNVRHVGDDIYLHGRVIARTPHPNCTS